VPRGRVAALARFAKAARAHAVAELSGERRLATFVAFTATTGAAGIRQKEAARPPVIVGVVAVGLMALSEGARDVGRSDRVSAVWPGGADPLSGAPDPCVPCGSGFAARRFAVPAARACLEVPAAGAASPGGDQGLGHGIERLHRPGMHVTSWAAGVRSAVGGGLREDGIVVGGFAWARRPLSAVFRPHPYNARSSPPREWTRRRPAADGKGDISTRAASSYTSRVAPAVPRALSAGRPRWVK
jgi:hypothetical protein